MAQIIDLSVPITKRAKHLSKLEIEYFDHKTFQKMRAEELGIKDRYFAKWGYCASDKITLSTHDGTHLDAPYHYAPMSEGKAAKTIDCIPLEWCYGDGVVLDFHHFERERPINVKDIENMLEKITYKLKPLDIVLIRTDASKSWFEENYRSLGAGLTAESTEWLIDQGVKVMGIDAWTWDQPFDVMLKKNKPERFLEAHKVGYKREYCHIESLANLDMIPRPFGFKVAVFPIKVENASGAWTRAVAIVD